jgi:hypothetical protein
MKTIHNKIELKHRASVLFTDLFLIILLVYIMFGDFHKVIFDNIELSKSVIKNDKGDKQGAEALLICNSKGEIKIDGDKLAFDKIKETLVANKITTLHVGIDKNVEWRILSPLIELLTNTKDLEVYMIYEDKK